MFSLRDINFNLLNGNFHDTKYQTSNGLFEFDVRCSSLEVNLRTNFGPEANFSPARFCMRRSAAITIRIEFFQGGVRKERSGSFGVPPLKAPAFVSWSSVTSSLP